MTGIVWFRRDLRLDDNPAWAAATAECQNVVALFVLEPQLLHAASDVRRNQLLGHLAALNESLVGLGGMLVVRHGPAQTAVPRLVDEVGATALFVNVDATPFSMARDRAVARSINIPVRPYHGTVVHEPGKVLTKAGTLSQVFTPFYKTWSVTAQTPWPSPGPGRPITHASDELPAPSGPVRQVPGQVAAWNRLDDWLGRVESYPTPLDLPSIDGTSDLSADLKFGTLSPRAIAETLDTTQPGHETFLRQIAWRDWWAHTLVRHPDLANTELKPNYQAIVWRNNNDDFERWCRGQTGFPIVDAGMRQLAATGWMHNRVRMITASFLVKDLLIDWRRGERFFRHWLVDADLAQNAGNWQWVAGTGPDAAPYFRIFNPTTQSKKFDPDGAYIKRWVPELASLPRSTVHEPSLAGPLELALHGVTLGDTYPWPIVDHAKARTRTLAAYRAALNDGP
ncbi:MAG: deoxyribodipyrimidine photo-lyase [Acidimicrobiales bacterium]